MLTFEIVVLKSIGKSINQRVMMMIQGRRRRSRTRLEERGSGKKLKQ